MPDRSNRARGTWGENRAAAHLRRIGHEIVDRNWRSPDKYLRGDLDIVSRIGGIVVICEVKARRRAAYGGAAAAVDAAKQAQVRRLAESWLRHSDQPYELVRFDVVAIDGVHLEHHESAF